MSLFRKYKTNYGYINIYHQGKESLDINIPNEISKLVQVHGDRMVEANPLNSQEADAQFTKKWNLVLEIRTADCIPLVLWNEREPMILAIHSGWKGSLHEITKKSMIQIQEQQDSEIEWRGWMGPSISKNNYEVKHDMMDQFPQKSKIFFSKLGDRYFFDNPSLVKSQINEIHPENKINLEHTQVCSFESDEYYSHRKGDKERNFTFVWMTHSVS
jgi:YfiH family protein